MVFFRLYFVRLLPLLLSLITGCTVCQRHHEPTPPLPEQYSLAKQSASPQKTNQFWSISLGDPILIGLIDQALSGSNLDIQKAYANICQARAELGITKADLFPQLNADGKFRAIV